MSSSGESWLGGWAGDRCTGSNAEHVGNGACPSYQFACLGSVSVVGLELVLCEEVMDAETGARLGCPGAGSVI